ncbi:MAG TPA: hypothetical protein VIM59_03685 [Cellvibrio sp.]
MKIVFLCCLALIITACASTPHSSYRAANGDGAGYKDIALDNTSYRVQFKMRGNQRTAAGEYALQRAAELTLNAGYDWFIVSKEKRRLVNEEDNSPDLPETFSTRRCGLLGCKTQTYRTPQLDAESGESYTLVLLDIHMGRGIRPEKNSYDAQETWERLSAKK